MFASIPPGFSNIALSEAESKLEKVQNLHTTKGGLSFNGTIEDIVKTNILLGVPSRILIRLSKFRAENFEVLIKKISDIPFELFILKNKEIYVHATAKKSRLIHTGAIEERVKTAVRKRLEANESLISKNHMENPVIFVRASHDTITVSVDSSGDPLYKRGVKKLIANAPLRENLAFASILKSGFKKNRPFFDPMCGTGTFSIEAAMISQNIPPGSFREFAFKSWPVYDESYNFYQDDKTKKNSAASSQIFASDIDYKNLVLLKKNIAKTPFENHIKKACLNFFNLKPGLKTGTIAINPPYGIRLEKEKKLILKIEKKLVSDFKGWDLIFTIPVELSSNYFSSKNFDKTNFIHGGLDMNLFTGKIR